MGSSCPSLKAMLMTIVGRSGQPRSWLTKAPFPNLVHGPQGCKWMLQRFRQYLASKHGPEAVESLFSDMDNIFIKSLQSVQKVIISDKHCFELYGYDILIDQDLKP